MKFTLIALGVILIIASSLFFMWLSAMGCMSTTGGPCHRNDFLTEEAIYLFYAPVTIGCIFIFLGIRRRK